VPLVTQPNLAAPDDFYEALIDAHRDLASAQSHELNAKLVLLLGNHVGDFEVLREALSAARASVLDKAGTV
jgi:xanthine/CO dehydrogenase XdhC/CoxF family maturation factor